LAALPARGQADLAGVIDIHVHSDPDSMPRSIDAIDLAKLAKQRGMRGLVLKNHYESTAALAYWCARKCRASEFSAASTSIARWAG
jgi:hypothetical protein